MAVLQAELNNSNGYFLTGTYLVFANGISSNGHLLNAVSNLVGQPNNGISNATSALLQFLSYSSASNGYSLSTLLVLTPQININIGQYQQYLSSLVRFFGANASQSATHLTITKASIGVQPLTNSTAESLLVGILLTVLQEESNSLISNVYISVFRRYIEPGNQPLLISNLVVSLYMKILYEQNKSELLDNVMINYTTVLTPNQFNS
jgi:hypothetical protein